RGSIHLPGAWPQRGRHRGRRTPRHAPSFPTGQCSPGICPPDRRAKPFPGEWPAQLREASSWSKPHLFRVKPKATTLVVQARPWIVVSMVEGSVSVYSEESWLVREVISDLGIQIESSLFNLQSQI